MIVQDEKRKLKAVFNMKREEAGVLLRIKTNKRILRNRVENLYAFVCDDGEILIAADTSDSEYGFCVSLFNIGFVGNDGAPLTVDEVLDLIE